MIPEKIYIGRFSPDKLFDEGRCWAHAHRRYDTDIEYIANISGSEPANQQGKWISCDNPENYPEIGKYVLCFYTIKDFEYYVIGRITTITKGSDYISAEWIDEHYNSIKPQYYQLLPDSPIKKKQP